MLLFASALKNPLQASIENAAVWVEGDSIWFAGPKNELPQEALEDPETLDLGDVVLAPGLVNAHAHLELTGLAKLKYPGCFVSWIREVLRAKQELSIDDANRAMPKSIMQSLLGGTTSIGDHMSVTGDLESLLYSPLRGKVFLEVLGVVPEVAREVFTTAVSLQRAYKNFPGLFEVIISPHSVHALAPEVLDDVLAQAQGLFSLHLAESAAEQRYFAENSGPMEEFIAARGSPLPRRGTSAMQELEIARRLDPRILAVHGNYFSDDDLERASRHEMSIVHCPLSHRYFSHAAFPMEAARARHINVALGTDSLASARSLSMFEVMRAAGEDHPSLDAETLFAMATLGGAKALKLEGQIGSLAPGKKADLIAVSRPARIDPMQALFHAKRVAFSMIDGKVILT